MDWLTFISNLVDAAISWPVAIVAIAYMLREPLKGLLNALENFETLRLGAGGVTVDITTQLQELSKLREDGIITERDFNRMKERLLSEQEQETTKQVLRE